MGVGGVLGCLSGRSGGQGWKLCLYSKLCKTVKKSVVYGK